MTVEIWKPIPGHLGYEVSDHGRVRSLDRLVFRATSDFRRKGQILTPTIDGDGYPKVQLGRGKENQLRVHKLVANAFVPNPEDLPQIDHEDTDKTNCLPGNLRWCTRAKNSEYRHHTTYKTCAIKVTPETLEKIVAGTAAGRPILHMAKEFGLSRAHIRRLSAPDESCVCAKCSAEYARKSTSKRIYCTTCVPDKFPRSPSVPPT